MDNEKWAVNVINKLSINEKVAIFRRATIVSEALITIVPTKVRYKAAKGAIPNATKGVKSN